MGNSCNYTDGCILCWDSTSICTHLTNWKQDVWFFVHLGLCMSVCLCACVSRKFFWGVMGYFIIFLLQIFYRACQWQNFWKSVNILLGYGQEFDVLFFDMWLFVLCLLSTQFMLVGLVSIVLVFLCVSWATVSVQTVHLFVPCCPAVMLHCEMLCHWNK